MSSYHRSSHRCYRTRCSLSYVLVPSLLTPMLQNQEGKTCELQVETLVCHQAGTTQCKSLSDAQTSRWFNYSSLLGLNSRCLP
ncbi:hypothetical protein RRG08_019046 [Elysia crispata]|uniref:Uncharacterized protein n=1 Tax=Elysia crispata TaxID=231223 RepID=A0AAE1A5F3_9GAST|nr:hypothetical protein RRG08_019046 [Elysia crispata]